MRLTSQKESRGEEEENQASGLAIVMVLMFLLPTDTYVGSSRCVKVGWVFRRGSGADGWRRDDRARDKGLSDSIN
jgi:hypothetical protein